MHFKLKKADDLKSVQANKACLQILSINEDKNLLPSTWTDKTSVLEEWIKSKSIKDYQVDTLEAIIDDHVSTLIFFQLPEKNIDIRNIRKLATRIGKAIKANKAQDNLLVIPKAISGHAIEKFLSTLVLSGETFGYQSDKKKEDPQTIHVYQEGLCANIVEVVEQIVDTVSIARGLVNETANHMTPEIVADRAVEAGKKYGFKVEVKSLAEIKSMGMDAFWNVARGSSNEPKFIVLEYLNAPNDEKKLALVGKGITFDSGGYSLKPSTGMTTMHCDMSGAASVIGAVSLLAVRKEKVNVVGVSALCENLIGPHSYKPGDVIGSLSGKTIEVLNTDAEGRVSLADSVYYANDTIKATHIIDIATLTGACMVALGKNTTGVITNDEMLWGFIKDTQSKTGDKFWRMPDDDEIEEGIKSTIADLKNMGADSYGGMISGGVFIKAFTGGKPWAHLDIAGPAFASANNDFSPAGASGVGVEALYHIAVDLFK